LGRLLFNSTVDITYCNYDDINEKFKEFAFNNEDENYKNIYITDISVNEEIAELIDTDYELSEKVILLDHHPTAEWLNKYEWCNVEVYNENGKLSGTTLLFEEFQNLFHNGNWASVELECIYNFVETVRKYDTWEWATKYNSIEPKQLNDLFYLYGRKRFINMIIDKILNYEDLFSSQDKLMLELNQEKIDRYIESKQKQLIEKDILGYKAGVIFAEQYHSEVGNTLATNNPHLDFIVLINPSYSISYRTVKDINLGEDIAKIYGGGGHPKAAGSPISDDIRNKIIELIFN
jgi:oligoribonuclease NrnB/cAMP/cGMP phosphodiesterase (DHH superfamily)